jgi:hypothetical protein
MDKIEEEDLKKLDVFFDLVYKSADYWTKANVIIPLMKSILESPKKKSSLKPSLNLLLNRMQKSAVRMKAFKEDSKASCDTEIQVLRKTFVYLALFETTIVNMVDEVILLLIVNGHDFYVYDKRKYASSLKDLPLNTTRKTCLPRCSWSRSHRAKY